MSENQLEIPTTTPISVYIMLALGLTSFAFSAILVRLAQAEGIPSLFVASSRLVIAALVLTPWVVIKYRNNLMTLNRQDLFLGFGAGVFLA
mgnify:CR=1 FL=1